MKSAARIALVYALVSALATAANIGTQAVSMWAYSGAYAVALSVLAGTAMGFPIKYVLEKKHVEFGLEVGVGSVNNSAFKSATCTTKSIQQFQGPFRPLRTKQVDFICPFFVFICAKHKLENSLPLFATD